ncbi:dihydrodipicolinate synthase family protein [Succinatimonas hippei]|uniref:dihydrodipicolinate synthase family protein n=1 Tax=Succinatimonas hippei TaxID=626938 RepID=UPI0026EB332D|nr:dihydrodipicolinate synthase family protein [Succinatimonas hippei]
MARVFEGIIPPISSFFTPDFKIDKESYKKQIDFLIENGVDGIFFLGTGGEFSQMSAEERKEVAEFAVPYVNKRVKVLIGVGSTNMREAVDLAVHAKECGADGVVAINPYYWKVTREKLLNYFSQIAKSIAPLPLVLYNFPGLTGQDLDPEFVKEVVINNPNVVGIKETIDSIGHITSMINTVCAVNPDFAVFNGFDNHFLTNLMAGGAGMISASGNFAPYYSVATYKYFKEGDMANACKTFATLMKMPDLYALDNPFVNVVKETTKLCALKDISTVVLPPSLPLPEEKKALLKEKLTKMGLIK